VDKVYIVFHTFEQGHQLIPFRKREDAAKRAAEIVLEYATATYGVDDEEYLNAKVLFDVEDFEGVVDFFPVSEMDDKCNVEILEEEVN
jgi:hypothetical protein